MKFLSNSVVILLLSKVEVELNHLPFVLFSYKPCVFQVVDSLLSVIPYAYLHTATLQTTVVAVFSHSFPRSYRLSLIHALLENIEKLIQNRKAVPTVQTSSTVLTFAKALYKMERMMMADVLQDPQLTVRLLTCFQQLYEYRSQLCIESDAATLSNMFPSISSEILSGELEFDLFLIGRLNNWNFSNEVVSFILDQIQSNQSSTRLCFYITFLSNLRMRFSFAIPSATILSILRSFDSIVYKAAIRLFAYCKDAFLDSLASLSDQDRTQALTIIIQHGFTLKTDIVAPKGKAQDAYSIELRHYLAYNLPSLKSYQFNFHAGMDAFSMNNYPIFYMRVLSFCAQRDARWIQTMIDVCTEMLVCTGFITEVCCNE